MTIDHQLFQHDYELSALRAERVHGYGFEMLLTPRFRHHFVDQTYDPMTASLFAARCHHAEVLIDVGAHYGFFSLLAIQQNPSIEILAIEPVPENHEVLSRNLSRHEATAARPLQLAASHAPGTTRLFRSLASDNCSFYPHPDAPPIGEIEVEATTVDQLLTATAACPTIVKIDTDGHELSVLAGMSETLQRFPDLELFVELNPKMQRLAGHPPEELLAALQSHGFDLFLLDDKNHLPFKLQGTDDWAELMWRPDGYANLYCRRRQRSLAVCFFSHSAGLDGAERSLIELVTELIRDEGVVCSVVLPGDGACAEQLRRAGAGVLVQPYGWWACAEGEGRGAETALRLAEDLALLRRQGQPTVAKLSPGVVVTHTSVIPWGAIAAAELGLPHAWHVCEASDGLDFFLPFEEILTLIRRSSRRLFTPLADLRQRLFPELGEDQCPVLHRFIEVPGTDDDGSATSLFRRPTALKLAVFGTLCPTKQQALAITAAAELLRRGHDVELLLAGSRPERYDRPLQDLARREGLAERIHFAGFLPDPYPAMRRADVVLVTSRSEGFGRVAVEAMLLGKVVVFPALPSLLEYLEDGVTGLAYPPGDGAALVNVLERVGAGRDLRRRLGEAARKAASAKFTREDFGGKAARALRDLEGTEPAPSIALPLLSGIAHQLACRSAAASPEEHSAENAVLALLATEADRQEEVLSAQRARLASVEAELIAARTLLDLFERSIAWRLVAAAWRIIHRVLPRGTQRRRLYDVLLSRLRERPLEGEQSCAGVRVGRCSTARE